MKHWNRIHKIGKKLITLCIVSFLLLCISVLSSTMLTTVTFTTTEASGIIQNIGHGNGSNALWAVIIPASFFLVIFSRQWKSDKRDEDN
jgi:H+/Cl- antiporter ClcA